MKTFVVLVFQKRSSHSKIIFTKVKVLNFSAEQTVYWSTQTLVVAVPCLGFKNKDANPKSIG